MKKSLLIGAVLSVIVMIVAGIKQDMQLILIGSGWIALGAIVLSGILLGAFISGDQIRANTAGESREDRRERVKMSINIVFVGLPSIVIFIIYFVIYNYV
ncbi:DUF5316 domain-containing protein [Longirhabdus pacifica]|uniref:DUF5316 domain-containing protein n=1 Tax=Longirhabdus pacifica TaxID=2305227 RepID=UPI0010088342|nr:DUF5316 domain-containing protein [Longirhabdus pacifica]